MSTETCRSLRTLKHYYDINEVCALVSLHYIDYSWKGIIHKEFVLQGIAVSAQFYSEVTSRLREDDARSDRTGQQEKKNPVLLHNSHVLVQRKLLLRFLWHKVVIEISAPPPLPLGASSALFSHM